MEDRLSAPPFASAISDWGVAFDFACDEALRAHEAIDAGDIGLGLALNQSARYANALGSRLFQQSLSA